MSGGVDSAVAAYLIREQGFDCTGMTMKLFSGAQDVPAREHSCCTLEDVEDARAVAYQLGMEHYVFNFTADFENTVIKKFVCAYETGATPNPCIDCNRYIKFAKLLVRAQQLGQDYVITGHYARIEQDKETGSYLLKKAADATKDQSYVLYYITQKQLAHTLLPLGDMTKKEVREIAQEQNFINAKKGDSQDICFAPDGDYAAFIEEYTGKRYPPGDFVDTDGRAVGKHNGLIRYTIGQRRGLGLAMPEPVYVCKKDITANTITVGGTEALFSTELIAADLNWISGALPNSEIRIKAKVRYRQPEQWAKAHMTDDDRLHVVFDQSQRAITAGQAVVLYDGETVLGGGTIIE